MMQSVRKQTRTYVKTQLALPRWTLGAAGPAAQSALGGLSDQKAMERTPKAPAKASRLYLRNLSPLGLRGGE